MGITSAPILSDRPPDAPARPGLETGKARASARSGRALTLLAVLVLAVFNLALISNALMGRDSALNAAQDSTDAVCQAVVGQMEATVSRIVLGLEAVNDVLPLLPHGGDRGDPTVLRFLQRQSDLLPMVRALIVTDSTGLLIHDSQTPSPVLLDLSDRDYFQAHTPGRNGEASVFIGKPVLGRTSGTWFISMSRRLAAADGSFNGVVTAVVDPALLSHAFESLKLKDNGAVTVLREDGTLLLRAPDFDRYIGTDQSTSRLYMEVLAPAPEGSSSLVTGLDGQDRLLSWSRVGSWPLIVTVSLSRDAVLADWRHSLPIYLGTMVITSLLILALIAQVRRQIGNLDTVVHDLIDSRTELIAAHQAALLANRAKTQFLANMSHELRTPLNAIIGFSDMLISGVHGPLMVRQKEYARDIHLSAMHLLDLINDILDVAKIESGSYVLQEQNVNLADEAKACERMLRGRISEKRLTFETLCLDEQPWVRGDERAIRQILLNLLSNAVKFTPEGGLVTLSMGPMPDGSMTVTVSDTGIGIPPEHLDLVLCPFHQVDTSDTRRHEGTGLGLPLAKALAEKHGGALRLDSRVGEGTHVTVLFPAERVLASRPTEAARAI
ncbi:sensor histidine kinase [Pararhodospirillum oryzae]|uniref:histidine kinase n=1 Tax=Pararhodospirillum oryzae TaxID=478448 RepID=A0A512HC49_9PROT|nr:ATP-binding protein [Pararhodospirillum oryzae]GEO83025.1 two-component sensor histidine kinase [Pararhodospirillum oryzae]